MSEQIANTVMIPADQLRPIADELRKLQAKIERLRAENERMNSALLLLKDRFPLNDWIADLIDAALNTEKEAG